VKGNGKIITLVLDLYFKGVSLRKIKDHLQQFYDLDIDHTTIYRWIIRFTKVMNQYVKQFTPKVSDAWHVDEQNIKVKNKWLWSWNVLDEKTRFLLANNITEYRHIEDAREVLRKAKETAIAKPQFVITDGLLAYGKAIRKEFKAYKNRVNDLKHIRLETVRRHPNNNLIERYHSTFRERDKVMRGFKTKHTAQQLSEGFRTYYNFIKQHQGLNGKTPSEVADIDLNLNGNRWLGLLTKSLKNKV
jgi:transposase-like protein